MESHEFTAEASQAGQRIDVFLVHSFKNAHSRTFLKRILDSDGVLVDGKPVKAHYIIRGGESVKIEIPDPEVTLPEPQDIPLNIVYEDQDVIVINKQAGLVVHPAPGNRAGTLVNALLFHCKDLSGVGGEIRPGIVHRIDKDTTGLLVCAKNDNAHKFLAKQFKDKEAGRIYIALVKGVVQLDNGIIDMPIGRHSVDRQKMDVEFADGRDAVTIYKVLERYKDFTMLELTLRTGRTHQIRVHLNHIGYPILGDKSYGYPLKGMNRQALHAKTLAFIHPRTKKKMEFDSKLPDDMMKIIEKGEIGLKAKNIR